ncbi:7425_t:CDS:2 [Cetraspora pellucida]|uniref:7425_t:CDS:1 n=1 Tax=Cetraspora pellucida TaxID=1433469 RepID=A0ACA9K6S3_9GLOM|nr:7425_t:CDS:2 [Cetraspora pellucida]
MPTRWFLDKAWSCVDFIIKEPFIGISKNLNQVNDVTFQQTAFIPKHYNNIQEKALSYSLEDNDQNNLDNIILGYISERETKKQLERRNIFSENMNLNIMIKSSDRHDYNANNIKNPLKHQGKGRPAGK